jgi:hypothetical protein
VTSSPRPAPGGPHPRPKQPSHANAILSSKVPLHRGAWGVVGTLPAVPWARAISFSRPAPPIEAVNPSRPTTAKPLGRIPHNTMLAEVVGELLPPRSSGLGGCRPPSIAAGGEGGGGPPPNLGCLGCGSPPGNDQPYRIPAKGQISYEKQHEE